MAATRGIASARRRFSASAGVRMLRALGYNSLTRFHMNEGHASLLTVRTAL